LAEYCPELVPNRSAGERERLLFLTLPSPLSPSLAAFFLGGRIDIHNSDLVQYGRSLKANPGIGKFLPSKCFQGLSIEFLKEEVADRRSRRRT
jgi:hypothetical protein